MQGVILSSMFLIIFTNIKQTTDVTISYNVEIAPQTFELNLSKTLVRKKQDSISVLNQNAKIL